MVGTRHVLTAVRTFLDPTDPADLDRVHALQDSIVVEQPGGPRPLRGARLGPISQKKVRDALLMLNETLPDLRRAAGALGEVDPIRHLFVTASGWGANPDRDAVYLNVTPTHNDGDTIYRLHVGDVPVGGFWSITVDDHEGLLRKNDRDLYAIDNITAARYRDGSVTVHFGGCDDDTPNCFPIFPGWNYHVRLYRPRREILDHTYVFPQPEQVE